MPEAERSLIDRRVAQLFAQVSEALAAATHALLNGDPETARSIIAADQIIDDMTSEVGVLVWNEIESEATPRTALRHLVSVLLILPELERSADLAEHIAQRAAISIGAEMSPASRGFVQRMSEVALEMWRTTAVGYQERSADGVVLDEADEEIDILHNRLTMEVGTGRMAAPVASEVTLIGRFYERLGDHAVNLARRIETLSQPGASPPED